MVIIENENIRVALSEKGAEIRSLRFKGEEQLWCGDPDIWDGVSPVLFPNCGTLRRNRFILNGKEYGLKKHGFARNSIFSVEEKSRAAVTFLLKENEETFKVYPWCFEFRVKYLLEDNSIKVTYEVKNNSETDMYAAVGSHEAYACPDGVENYDVIFEKKETLDTIVLEGPLITNKTKRVLYDGNVLPLYKSYFVNDDTLVFGKLNSRFLTLRNRKTGKSISVDFEGYDYLLIWQKYDAPFVCIEPWVSLPPKTDWDFDITQKEGMLRVGSGETATKEHKVIFG